MRKHDIRIGILGATGTVGQRMIALLERHSWFTVTALGASPRSAGKKYRDAVHWTLDSPMPESVAGMVVHECAPGLECDIVLSGMDNAVAGPIEEAFAAAGYPVISNAKNHRMEADVPLVIAEVNADHLELIHRQRKNRGWEQGFLVTNPNCSTIGLVSALKPLHDAFGLEKVAVTTLQALSGSGYPGVPSIDILDNVLPYIGGEEGKMETETLKLLGSLGDTGVTDASVAVSAQCNRVHVRDGHLECVSVALGKDVSEAAIREAWESYEGGISGFDLPSAPHPFIIYTEEEDRPQPRRDRDAGKGMAVTIGRLRKCPVLGWKFVVLSHNTVRGAAGAAIENAELLVARGFVV